MSRVFYLKWKNVLSLIKVQKRKHQVLHFLLFEVLFEEVRYFFGLPCGRLSRGFRGVSSLGSAAQVGGGT